MGECREDKESPTEMCSETQLGDPQAWSNRASAGCIRVLIVELVAVMVTALHVAHAAINNMIIWSYDHIRGVRNDMKGETSKRVRGGPAGSPGHVTVKKRFGNIGANCQTQSDMVARSVVEGDPCVEDQSDDDEGKMQITVRTLEGKMISM